MTNSSPLAKGSQSEALEEDEEILTSFCRALYQYKAQDASGLSFKPGDIIEVFNQEPSGWWDGILGDERGWFPHNYVELISDEEAERLISSSDSSGPETLDLSHAISPKSAQYTDATRKKQSGTPQLNDFWMPQVTPEGQIFYKNTQTGQHSREIPHEVADVDIGGLSPRAQVLLRSGESGGAANKIKPPEPQNAGKSKAGFGVPPRTGVPEPWVKRLHDDGLSYYYYNKVDGQIRWTKPRDPERTSPQPSPSFQAQPKVPDEQHKHRTKNSGDPVIPHYGLDSEPTHNHVQSKKSTKTDTQRTDTVTAHPTIDHKNIEAVVQKLHVTIVPSPPDPITEFASVARSAIEAVIASVQLTSEPRKGEDQTPSKLVGNVILSVRNLVYIFGVPTHPMPSAFLPRPAPSSKSALNIAQRTVIASLSRLAFSARSIQHYSRSMRASTMSQIRSDAEVLLHDVKTFVLEVTRQAEPKLDSQTQKQPKRLRGVFSSVDIGPGLIGAGAAGRWKGFGWVQLGSHPFESQRILGPSVISELRRRLNDLDVQFQYLLREIQSFVSVEQLRPCGQELVSQVSSMLAYVSDVHVARHVDIDELQQDGNAANSAYGQTVVTGRNLVRTLEAVVQAMYDDIAIFLLALQSIPSAPQYRQQQIHALKRLNQISSSLSTNTSILLDSLVNLLSLGHEQARMASGDYYGTAEWRTSRSSGQLLSTPTADKEQDADLINMELAFEKSSEIDARVFSPKMSALKETEQMISTPLVTEQDLAILSQDEREWEVIPDTREPPRELDDDDDTIEAVKSPPRSTGKLERILGDDYARKVAADLKPQYLRPNYNPGEIQIDPDNSVRGGTLSALVERLTAHENVDTSFNRAFLMTFKLFTKVDRLFDLLVERFKIEPPPSLKANELEDWEEHKKHLVQIRVINTFVTMLKDNDILDRDDFYILERIRFFVLSDPVSQFGAAKQVLVYIDRLVKHDGNPLRTIPQSIPPPPILPRTSVVLKLGDIDPLELARQLAMLESKLYQKVRPMECLLRAREQRIEALDNITPIIQTSNRMADWVADLVLSKDDSRKRLLVLKQLIVLADRCRILNNFSTMTAIISGLNRPAISRLKRTWQQVNQRTMAQFAACEAAVDCNKTFTKYRQLLTSVNPPCVPFIGVFLSTLQFIHDGNPDMLPNGLVNFRKHQMASEVINDIKRCQSRPYNFQVIPSVQAYIEESLNRYIDTKASAERFWAMSLEREPRERDDERMARLLQETGFL